MSAQVTCKCHRSRANAMNATERTDANTAVFLRFRGAARAGLDLQAFFRFRMSLRRCARFFPAKNFLSEV
ncbi:hypothetical protein [Lysobacter enzymogenes]|uniref:hypothetical protein n=1 Tax=Lysobacter enzymogenes TaxID=69 RepID=UPI003393AD27